MNVSWRVSPPLSNPVALGTLLASPVSVFGSWDQLSLALRQKPRSQLSWTDLPGSRSFMSLELECSVCVSILRRQPPKQTSIEAKLQDRDEHSRRERLDSSLWTTTEERETGFADRGEGGSNFR